MAVPTSRPSPAAGCRVGAWARRSKVRVRVRSWLGPPNKVRSPTLTLTLTITSARDGDPPSEPGGALATAAQAREERPADQGEAARATPHPHPKPNPSPKPDQAKQQELRAWLGELGLGDLAPNFIKAGVDVAAMQFISEVTLTLNLTLTLTLTLNLTLSLSLTRRTCSTWA